ncbi:hypothetical protein [Microvirga mediterraneensis]|uniref:Uncharacterized protein n=1 Tax=Microvirga mediterraneensis TaxID=2754695 RepID=A0A838BLQ2_9HYPH|nr:hypothetical protein [Microvirga mediterraneensis]MBA1156025.1 hypothetical protein [Microvirga mediterraneensis]
MASDPTCKVSLTAKLNPLIRAQIASGRYREVVWGNPRKGVALPSDQAHE